MFFYCSSISKQFFTELKIVLLQMYVHFASHMQQTGRFSSCFSSWGRVHIVLNCIYRIFWSTESSHQCGHQSDSIKTGVVLNLEVSVGEKQGQQHSYKYAYMQLQGMYRLVKKKKLHNTPGATVTYVLNRHVGSCKRTKTCTNCGLLNLIFTQIQSLQ